MENGNVNIAIIFYRETLLYDERMRNENFLIQTFIFVLETDKSDGIHEANVAVSQTV